VIRLAMAALALAAGGCDAKPEFALNNSITVKLPPARPAPSVPGFAFQRVRKAHG
jgi:hypothetical protein